MNSEIVIVDQTNDLMTADHQIFNDTATIALKTVSANSARVYSDTFARWRSYTEKKGCDLLDITPGNVLAFLEGYSQLSKASLQRMLSALRSFTRVLAVIDPQYQRHYEALKIVNIKQLGSQGAKRTKKALNSREIHKALDTYLRDNLTDRRNAAVLAVAFYVGLRRSEIAALRWADIDLERGLITVEGGKGKKDSTEAAPVIPLLGDGTALAILLEWRKATPPDREFVFTSIRRGDHFGSDKPISGEAIRMICEAAGDFKPHDARRTLITGLLNAGTPLHVAQAQARHASGQTTLGYAKVADAEEIKGRAKLDY